jgi:hypothetical protein
MMQVQKISEETSISDESSVRRALDKLRKVPEHELQYYLVQRDTLQATTPATRQAITLAQMEYERRANGRTRCLAVITTVISGAVGLLGVVLGVYLANGTADLVVADAAPAETQTTPATPSTDK